MRSPTDYYLDAHYCYVSGAIPLSVSESIEQNEWSLDEVTRTESGLVTHGGTRRLRVITLFVTAFAPRDPDLVDFGNQHRPASVVDKARENDSGLDRFCTS